MTRPSCASPASTSALDVTPTNPANIPSQGDGAIGRRTLATFIACDIFGTQASSAFRLATFDFEAVAASMGTTVTARGSDNRLIFINGSGEDGRPVAFSIFDGSASATIVVTMDDNMSVIPLPASALLLLSGAASLAGLGRRHGS